MDVCGYSFHTCNFSIGLKVFIMTFWKESSPGNYNTKILPQSVVPRAAASTVPSDLLERQILSPRPPKSEPVRQGPANRLTSTPRERNHGWRPGSILKRNMPRSLDQNPNDVPD